MAFSVRVWVGFSPLFCSAASHTCPLPSPLFLRIWEGPPQAAGTAEVEECRVGVGSHGGRGPTHAQAVVLQQAPGMYLCVLTFPGLQTRAMAWQLPLFV